MTGSKCRDCGRRGNEDPDDPAPNLCPGCYEQRLQQITRNLEAVAAAGELEPSIEAMAAWLERELRDVGGERPEVARVHAQGIATAFLLQQALDVVGEVYRPPSVN